MKAKVYFTKEITPEKVVEMYQALGPEKKEIRTSFVRNSGVPWWKKYMERL